MKKKTMLDILTFIVLFYVLALIALYFGQRHMIYLPDRTKPNITADIQLVEIQTNDNLNISTWYKPPSQTDKPTIILFHGNAGHHAHRYFQLKFFSDLGYGFLIAGYRGYGGNEGKPSETGFYNDARGYIKWLKDNKSVDGKKLIIMGESIGTGTAVQMAKEHDVKALILISPFYSLYRLAQDMYPIFPAKYVLKDQYLSNEKITEIDAPLFIIHGQKDNVIPYKHALDLFNLAIEPKQIKDFPQAKHNDIFSFGALNEIETFLTGSEPQNTDN